MCMYTVCVRVCACVHVLYVHMYICICLLPCLPAMWPTSYCHPV